MSLKIKVTVFEGEAAEGPVLAQDRIKWLGEQVSKVPPEFRNEVYVEDGYQAYPDGTGWPTVEVFYRRPETQDEVVARAQRKALKNNRKVTQELRELERLKAKYGE